LDQINSESSQIWYSNYWGSLSHQILILESIGYLLFFVFNFRSNQVWFITFLRQHIKPYCKFLKVYFLSILVEISLYLIAAQLDIIY
jgi:hypothetical protein